MVLGYTLSQVSFKTNTIVKKSHVNPKYEWQQLQQRHQTEISFKVFVDIISKRQETQELRELFLALDTRGNLLMNPLDIISRSSLGHGFIKKQDFLSLCKQHFPHLNSKFIETCFDTMDSNADHRVTFRDLQLI